MNYDWDLTYIIDGEVLYFPFCGHPYLFLVQE